MTSSAKTCDPITPPKWRGNVIITNKILTNKIIFTELIFIKNIDDTHTHTHKHLYKT